MSGRRESWQGEPAAAGEEFACCTESTLIDRHRILQPSRGRLEVPRRFLDKKLRDMWPVVDATEKSDV